eukprot:TRINITY_DN7620_c0_g1_i3.p1 TRINITY_DN7620_c0_g1~~TRINITY_DN7620_c0_g1_i3.p1  ORF type:complete len:614 (-),score=79.78 TRINITY_DN7620_c0_g1_i3:1490-3331(-)
MHGNARLRCMVHGVCFFGRLHKSREAHTLPFRAAVFIQYRKRLSLVRRGRDESAADANVALARIVARYFDTHMALFPFAAPLYGEYRYNSQFGSNLTPEYFSKKRRIAENGLAALTTLDYSKLSRTSRVTYAVFKYECENDLLQLEHPTHLLPFVHITGLHETFVMLGSGQIGQPFETAKDYTNWLTKCGQFPAYVDTALTNLGEGLLKGITLPRPVLERLIAQLEELVVTGTESPFFAPAAAFPEGIAATEQACLTEQLLRCIEQTIVPSFIRLKEYLSGEYKQGSRESLGLSAMPGGSAWYSAAIHNHVTVDWDTAKIFALGEEELHRIEQSMDCLRSDLGFSGTLHEYLEYLRDDPDGALHFRNGEELLCEFNKLKQRAAEAVPRLFDIDYPDFEIRQMEEFRSAGAPAAEYQAGVLYVNTANMQLTGRWQTETLFLHEGVPGHHLQASAALNKAGLPKFQQFASYTAFDEGWALYCEALGTELGFFQDPLQRLGHMHDDLLRAMRLIVDVGLHTKGWSREKAIEFMTNHSAMALEEIEAEVDRYLALPAQALAYKLGQHTFFKLRQEAEAELGPRFDIRAFHRVCLSSGSVPLHVLTTNVREWIISLRE